MPTPVWWVLVVLVGLDPAQAEGIAESYFAYFYEKWKRALFQKLELKEVSMS